MDESENKVKFLDHFCQIGYHVATVILENKTYEIIGYSSQEIVIYSSFKKNDGFYLTLEKDENTAQKVFNVFEKFINESEVIIYNSGIDTKNNFTIVAKVIFNGKKYAIVQSKITDLLNVLSFENGKIVNDESIIQQINLKLQNYIYQQTTDNYYDNINDNPKTNHNYDDKDNYNSMFI